MSRKRRDKGRRVKDKHPSDDEEEEQGEQGEETIPKQGKVAFVAEALADAITSAGQESGKASADIATAKRRCIECGNKMRLKDKNADLKRRLEELEEKHKYTN